MPRPVSVYNVRKAQRILDGVKQLNAGKLDPPKLADFVLATVIMARREQVDKGRLLAMISEVWDDTEEG